MKRIKSLRGIISLIDIISPRGGIISLRRGIIIILFFSLVVWLVGFLTSSSTTMLYRGRAPRQSI